MATTSVDGGDLVQIALAGLASFLVVIAIAPRARRLALRRGITDQPRDGKWHKSPTPYLGGAALVFGAIGASAALPGWELQAVVIILGAIVVSILGLVDDIRTVSPLRRVTVEVVVAAAAFTAGARVEIFNDPVDLVLTVAWFVFATNSFNLLDNMDGGMASIAAMVAAAIATVALVNGQVLVGGLAVVTAAACLGFLLFNWHPAQMFMGDAGSLFLGFMLAATSLKLRPDVSHTTSAVGLVLLLSPAVFDTSLVVVSRFRAGRPLYLGGTDHTSHRVMRLGRPPRSTALLLAAAAAVMSSSGVLVSTEVVAPLAAVVAVAIPCVIAAVYLLRVDVYSAPVETPVNH